MESTGRFLTIVAAVALVATAAAFPLAPNDDNDAAYGAWDPFRKLVGCHPGVNLDGLASLKQYLHRFGYLPNPSSNFSDYFDEDMEEAVKTYQTNFRLNPSGVLDNTTLSLMVRPRCGVPDVVNGTSTMNSGAVHTAAGAVAHFSFFPGRPTWPPFKRDLSYAFLPSSARLPADAQRLSSIFAGAFARWSNVTTLTFRETDSFGLADIQIGFYSGEHGDGEAFDGLLGTLAHAFSPPDGRFHLDADENWNVATAAGVEFGEIDLESVAVHEIGHLLGLGHSSDGASIMYPSITSGTRRVHLGSDDVQGIQQLYGANPSYTSPPGPSTQERDTSAGRRAGAIWSPLIMVATLLLMLL